MDASRVTTNNLGGNELVSQDVNPRLVIGNVFLRGNAKAHLGDVHNHYYPAERLEPSKIKKACGLCLGRAPSIAPNIFKGRENEVEFVKRALRPTDSSLASRRIVLGGLGGIGKTQLAIAYARHYADQYESIFWLNATTEVDSRSSLRAIAEAVWEASELVDMSDEQALLQVRQWLSNTSNTRWLLLVDNYDEPHKYSLESYIPTTSHGSVIITTRRPDLVSGEVLHLNPIENIDVSLEILESRSARTNTKSDGYARSLAARLGGLPLALATTGAYLRRSPWSFKQYLDEYDRVWNVNPLQRQELPEYQDRTLYTTWNISYARLEHDHAYAAKVLKLLAYFDHQDIFYELCSAGIEERPSLWSVSLVA